MSTTRAVTALAALIHASQQRKQTATGVAVDVDRAGMLMSPEIAAELETLRVTANRVMRAEQRRAELEAVLSTHRDDDSAEIDRLRKRVTERDERTAHLAECLVARTEDLTAAQARVDKVERAYIFDTAALKKRVAELETDLDRRNDDVTGACPARWDEEQASARLRLALKSAQRGRREARARVAELEAAPVTFYRAEHPDSGITLGHYGTPTAARAHCEAEERRSWPTGTSLVFDWIEDEEDRVDELVVTAGQNEESTTGYIVTALELDSEYDEGADA